jgi:hypothetical protein
MTSGPGSLSDIPFRHGILGRFVSFIDTAATGAASIILFQLSGCRRRGDDIALDVAMDASVAATSPAYTGNINLPHSHEVYVRSRWFHVDAFVSISIRARPVLASLAYSTYLGGTPSTGDTASPSTTRVTFTSRLHRFLRLSPGKTLTRARSSGAQGLSISF